MARIEADREEELLQAALDDFGDEGVENVIPESWAKEEITFPPFWSPVWNAKLKKGNGFKGTVLMRDERRADFHSYVIESAMPLTCWRGDTNDRTVEKIEAGQQFSVSVYAALPLENYFGLEVFVRVVGERKLPPNEKSLGKPRDLTVFELFVDPETRALLDGERGSKGMADKMKQLRATARNKALMAASAPEDEEAAAE